LNLLEPRPRRSAEAETVVVARATAFIFVKCVGEGVEVCGK
jgi:hypothetical protein